jgi:hypothetical protein
MELVSMKSLRKAAAIRIQKRFITDFTDGTDGCPRRMFLSMGCGGPARTGEDHRQEARLPPPPPLSPKYDEAPLAVANTPEVREYMALGIIDDEEIGQPSEIKEVVYAG